MVCSPRETRTHKPRTWAPDPKSGVFSQFHQRTMWLPKMATFTQVAVYDNQLMTLRGSNPDSSEPKSDVLPITPRVNLWGGHPTV